MVDKLTGKNISLSSEDYKEFLSISNELATLFPDLVVGYDSQGNALLNLGDSAKSVADSLEQLLDAERALADEKILENSGKIWEKVNSKNQDIAIKKDIANDSDIQKWLNSFKYDFSANGQTRLLSEDGGSIFSEVMGNSIPAKLSDKYGVSRQDIIRYTQEVLSDIFGAESQHGTNDIVVGRELDSDFNIQSYLDRIPSVTSQYDQSTTRNNAELIETHLATLRSEFQSELDGMSNEQQAN